MSWKVLVLDRTNSTAIATLHWATLTLWPVIYSDDNVASLKITIGAIVGTIRADVFLMVRQAVTWHLSTTQEAACHINAFTDAV